MKKQQTQESKAQKQRVRRPSAMARRIQRDLARAPASQGQRAPAREYYRAYTAGRTNPLSFPAFKRFLASYGVRFDRDMAILPPLKEMRRAYEAIHGPQHWRGPTEWRDAIND